MFQLCLNKNTTNILNSFISICRVLQFCQPSIMLNNSTGKASKFNFRASNGPWERSLFIYSVSLWLHNVCNVTFVVRGADRYRSKNRMQLRQKQENRNERWLNQITAIQIKNERLLLVIGHKMSWEPENHHHKKSTCACKHDANSLYENGGNAPDEEQRAPAFPFSDQC